MRNHIIMIASVALTGCVGTDVGNPETSNNDGTEVVFTTEVVDDPTLNGLTVRGATLEEAWVTIDNIELRRDCSASNAEIFDGPYYVDLLADEKMPIPIELGDQDYCRLTINLSPNVDGPEPLGQRSVFAAGTRADGAPFEISGVSYVNLRFKGARGNSIQVPKRTLGNLAVFSWVANGGIDALDQSELAISDLDAPNLFNEFERSLKEDSRVHADGNRDGRIDPDELEPIAIPE